MRNTTSLKSAFLTIISLTVLSACGSNGVTGSGDSALPQVNNNDIPSPIDNGSGFAAYPFAFSTYGAEPAVVTGVLLTDNMLKVRVRAEAATMNQGTSQPTQYVAHYKCATYQVSVEKANNPITVNGIKVAGPNTTWSLVKQMPTTSPLTVAGSGGCVGSIDYQDFDFSPFLNAGHGLVRVKVKSMQSDAWCIQQPSCGYELQQFGRYTSSFCIALCPLKTVWTTHTVNGNLEVQINGSSFQ